MVPAAKLDALEIASIQYIVTGSRYCCYAAELHLVLCCDQFDCGSRQVKHGPVDEDNDLTLTGKLVYQAALFSNFRLKTS